MFLIKEGFSDIKQSIECIQGKTDINLGDWANDKSFKFLTYIVTSLLPGDEIIKEAIDKIEIVKTIYNEFLNIGIILKTSLSKIKNKFANFIKTNFY